MDCAAYHGCRVTAEVKFCGLTRAEDADVAVSLGASYVGVIFAGGPRSLTVRQAINVLAVAPIAGGLSHAGRNVGAP